MGRTGTSGARVVVEMVRSDARTRADLCRRLGMSKGSISRLVDGLLRQGFLEAGERVGGSGRGRKTTLLRVADDLAYVVGADLEGMAVRACVLDCGKKVLASDELRVERSWSMDRTVTAWLTLIEDVISRSGVGADSLAGIGLGLPGLVSRESAAFHAYLPPGRWVDSDLSAAFSRFGVPVTAANNVVCVSEYERRLGVARGAGAFISVLARYGIGVAVCSDSSFLIGEQAFTGELGHMRVDPSGPECVCGQRGCLDVFASGRTLPPDSRRSGPDWEAELRTRGRYLGLAVGNLLKLFHPPLVVVNGIYNRHSDVVAPVLNTVLDEELGLLGLPAPKVTFGGSIPYKSAIGAALRAIDAFLEEHLERTVFRSDWPHRRPSKVLNICS